ncbi:hypothetical protein [Hyphomicrobium sp. ghe19]|uniref:hypothetical protein n=1 Tax=Hyphomicrobium sp. ghe19 TaxID=2682968 RepID=UPI0013677F92|nr:hypothetical protein HYPP_03757 [Hyphomicrobium sp. ghe19]
MEEYTPRDWFWIVGGDAARAWSSAARDYVTQYPSDRASRIANEVELFDVLSRINLTARAPSRSFTVEEIREALLRIDAEATGDASTAEDLVAVADEIGLMLPPIT